MKYVMLDNNTPILFPDHITHSKMKYVIYATITSAGFVKIVNDEVQVYGKSVSLGLESDPEDAFFIEKLLKSE